MFLKLFMLVYKKMVKIKGFKKKFTKIRKLVVFKLFILFIILSIIFIVVKLVTQDRVLLSPDPGIVYNQKLVLLETKASEVLNFFVIFLISGSIFFLAMILYFWFFFSSY